MAIEHLHLEKPVPVNPPDSPYVLTDRLLAEQARDIQILKPGKYDMTPRDTNYESRGDLIYQVEVLPKGTAVCGELIKPNLRSHITHPTHGKLEQPAFYIPDTATQICIVAMRKANEHRRRGIPHIFDILRWQSNDGSLSYLPGVAVVVANAEAATELRPFIGKL